MTGTLHGAVVVGVIAGLLTLLYAEAAHLGDAFVVGGGVLVVLSVGVLAAAIAWAEAGGDGERGLEGERGREHGEDPEARPPPFE
ncbi:hypothetical protein [Halomarina pelagica]|uniref:hypothetical protein n=1 Tax=Halomarina pelagica TaxID=2961599 RepID=UPI0020C1CBB0|nr:hypothetical protein [Halomarina sp. BND7]